MLLLADVNLQELTKELCVTIFPEIAEMPRSTFCQKGNLASLVRTPGRKPSIYLHAILNHEDVPEYVFTFILKHELLHLLMPPQTLGGQQRAHSPEFFAKESLISPERDQAWRWIIDNLAYRLQVRPRKECLEVVPPAKACPARELIVN